MSVPPRYRRYVGPVARAAVSARAGVADAPWMQDWPQEVAAPARVAEFLALLDACSDDPDERFALMELVLCSLAEADERCRQTVWPEVRARLAERPVEYAYPILEQACLVERRDGRWVLEPDWEGYTLTAPMRELLSEISESIGFSELET